MSMHCFMRTKGPHNIIVKITIGKRVSERGRAQNGPHVAISSVSILLQKLRLHLLVRFIFLSFSLLLLQLIGFGYIILGR